MAINASALNCPFPPRAIICLATMKMTRLDKCPNSPSNVRSVIQNVEVLEKALQEHSTGQDPFGQAWPDAMLACCKDLERRIHPFIFIYSGVAVFRESSLTMAKCVAKWGLRDFVTRRPNG